MLLAAVHVQSCVSSPSSKLCSLIYSELSLHSLTSGLYPLLVHSPAMGLPVFGLDVRLQHASSNIGWRGNIRSRAVFMYVGIYMTLSCVTVQACVSGDSSNLTMPWSFFMASAQFRTSIDILFSLSLLFNPTKNMCVPATKAFQKFESATVIFYWSQRGN